MTTTEKAGENSDQSLYINREISWLEFNSRVLDEALDPTTPLLERLKFLSIFTSNLDEFFMVRVAGMVKMREEGLPFYEHQDSFITEELITRLAQRTTELTDSQFKCFSEIMDSLKQHGVEVTPIKSLSKPQKQHLKDYFKKSIFPVLTPLAYDAAHPFPFLTNLSLYLVLTPDTSVFEELENHPRLCFVELPSILPRLIPVKESKEEKCFQYVLLEDLIVQNLDELFVGVKFSEHGLVRVTRNLDYTLLENEVVDLLKSLKREMIVRQQQEVVRLEAQEGLNNEVVDLLKKQLKIKDRNVFLQPFPFHIPTFGKLTKLPFPELCYEPFNPRLPAALEGEKDIFSLIDQEDILVHHPYESFYTVTEFLRTAANDESVLAIKQTLYRTGGDSPIIESLIQAAENGKHVTAVVELKARFDEKNNISWARRLERAGVNVVFGFVDLKTHAKITLVIRRQKKGLERYVHLSTGNYNSVTAKLYTDIGLFTRDEELCEDASQIFNLVTGVSILRQKRKHGATIPLPHVKCISISPVNLRQHTLDMIGKEISNVEKGGTGEIFAKMNALVDRKIIDALYKASQAGVKIRLIVRGVCCLRPGVKGLSENIQVMSIVDRFLEHSRVFCFLAGGKWEAYLSSADWMPRNMDRRIELLFPVKNDKVKSRLIDEIMETSWADNVKARWIQGDGTYQLRKAKTNEPKLRSQARFVELAREEGLKSLPYDKAVRHDPSRSKGKRPVQKKKRKGR